MNKTFLILLFIKTIFFYSQITKNSSEINKTKIEKHYSQCQNDGEKCKCDVEYELKDSLKLTHIKNQFYKNKSGHLYEKTDVTKDGKNYFTYFTGCISQEIDPISFIELDGWFAKDKNNVYYFRPTSGGMQISKLEKADSKTFKIFHGIYNLGIDKSNLFNETNIVKDVNVKKIKYFKNENERIIKIISGKTEYKFEY